MGKFFKSILLLLVLALIIIAAIGCSKTGSGPVTSPTALTQGLSQESVSTSNQSLQIGGTQGAAVVEEQVVKDFKSDIQTLYKAWRAPDITEFRRVAAQGLAGSVLEAKVKEAEPFLLEADGADVNNINYLDVKVTKVEGNSATLESAISYSGYAYNPVNQTRGEMMDAPVTTRREYTLQFIDNKWYIVGEQDKKF